MSCSPYLQEDLISNKGGVGLLQISQKYRLFHLYDNQVFFRVISHVANFMNPPKKDFLSPSVFPKREYTSKLN